MIVVQDCIEVAPGNLARLQALVRERYRPGAEARGLRFLDERVSPPLRLAERPNTLWIRWTLEHAGAFWAARAAAGADASVAAFWAEIDGIAARRERHFLVAGDVALPGPEDVSAYRCAPAAWRETAQLHLRPDLPEAARAGLLELLGRCAAELPGLQDARVAANYVADYGAGHFTWDLLYGDRASADAARAGAFWRGEVLPALERCFISRSVLGLRTIGAGAREPSLVGGVKRTALFRLLPGVPDAARERFEQDTLEMPAHIGAIRNWRLSRAVPLDRDASDVEPWSYVWEQEYATLEGLTVDYMVHPHHWAHVDRAFDPESGAQLIDAALCHAFCALSEAFITR